jgi:ABC-type lipoprotein release transport system permease subunit
MMTRGPKRSSLSVASASQAELVFVVDVSSLTKEGFVGTTRYEGKQVELEFDDGTAGVFLDSEMAGRLRVRKGSALLLVVESENNEVVEASLAGVSKGLRISNPKVYYAVGREGGAVIRVRKG